MLDNLILFLFICISVYGAPVTTEVITAAAPGELTAYATFIGILAIVAGLFLAFSGYRLFRTALFVAGFLVFSNISSIVVQRLDTAQTVTGTTLLLICFGAGVIGGFVAQGLWRFGLSLIGAVGGGAIAASLLTLKSGFLIEGDGNRLLFILACAIIGAVMIHFFEKPMLIGSTAVAGSTVAIFGLDVFVKTGYADAVIFFLQNTRAGINNGIFPHAPLDYSYLFTGSVGGMVFGVIALTIAGSISQFKSAEVVLQETQNGSGVAMHSNVADIPSQYFQASEIDAIELPASDWIPPLIDEHDELEKAKAMLRKATVELQDIKGETKIASYNEFKDQMATENNTNHQRQYWKKLAEPTLDSKLKNIWKALKELL